MGRMGEDETFTGAGTQGAEKLSCRGSFGPGAQRTWPPVPGWVPSAPGLGLLSSWGAVPWGQWWQLRLTSPGPGASRVLAKGQETSADRGAVADATVLVPCERRQVLGPHAGPVSLRASGDPVPAGSAAASTCRRYFEPSFQALLPRNLLSLGSHLRSAREGRFRGTWAHTGPGQ